MTGLLIFIMGFSTLWIMYHLYARVSDIERCVNALCLEVDELRAEVVETKIKPQKELK
jgi:hypothetical protein